MATYIKKSYFLLLMIKLHGENLTTENEKEKKNQINSLFNTLSGQLICPLDDLELMYEQLIEAFIPTEGNQPKSFDDMLAIPKSIILLADELDPTPPQHSNLKENSPYISLTNAEQLAQYYLGQNYEENLNRLKTENITTITYQDLSWLRQERHFIRSDEYGNTDTYRSIAHKIKAAILERLYTLGNKIGEQTELQPTEYDKYLGMMQKNCGRHPLLTKFFRCNTESEFYTFFSKTNPVSSVDTVVLFPPTPTTPPTTPPRSPRYSDN